MGVSDKRDKERTVITRNGKELTKGTHTYNPFPSNPFSAVTSINLWNIGLGLEACLTVIHLPINNSRNTNINRIIAAIKCFSIYWSLQFPSIHFLVITFGDYSRGFFTPISFPCQALS